MLKITSNIERVIYCSKTLGFKTKVYYKTKELGVKILRLLRDIKLDPLERDEILSRNDLINYDVKYVSKLING